MTSFKEEFMKSRELAEVGVEAELYRNDDGMLLVRQVPPPPVTITPEGDIDMGTVGEALKEAPRAMAAIMPGLVTGGVSGVAEVAALLGSAIPGAYAAYQAGDDEGLRSYLSVLQEHSDTYGGGKIKALAGNVLDMMGVSEEDQEAFNLAADIGEVYGIGEGVVRAPIVAARQAGPALRAIDRAGQRAQSRLDENVGTTLMSGIDPKRAADELTAGAGQVARLMLPDVQKQMKMDKRMSMQPPAVLEALTNQDRELIKKLGGEKRASESVEPGLDDMDIINAEEFMRARSKQEPTPELTAGAGQVERAISPEQTKMDFPKPTVDVNPEAIRLSPQQKSASLISDLYEDGADQIEAGGNLYDVALRINTRSKAIGDMSEPTPENIDKIGDMLAAETLHAMKKTGNAGEWYRTKVANAMKIAERVYPEAAQDPNKMNALKFITAITSNGASVPDNSKDAFKVFDQYLQGGKMPIVGFGKEEPAMKSAFKLYNSFIDKIGEQEFFKFMSEEFTVRELNKVGEKYGFKVSGENMDTQLPASVIFGPKIGGGFYQNLQGNYKPLTMDRWFMRTWGRLTGSLIVEQSPEAAKKQLDRIRAAVTPDIAKQYGYNQKDLLSDDVLLVELAERATKDYAKSKYKNKTQLNKASKNYVEAQKKVLEQPRGGAHRAYMRASVDNALEKLSAQGVQLDRAALQALVWYPEKELYSKLGVGSKKSAPTDYETEFANIARERGIDVSDITGD